MKYIPLLLNTLWISKIAGFILLILFACSKENELNNAQFVGEWKEVSAVSVYIDGNGTTQTDVTDTNNHYIFSDNGDFQWTQSGAIKSGGNWKIISSDKVKIYSNSTSRWPSASDPRKNGEFQVISNSHRGIKMKFITGIQSVYTKEFTLILSPVN